MTLSNGAAGVVSSATTTTLTVTLSQLPTSTGPMTAIVTNGGGSSGTAVQVATVAFPALSGLPATANYRAIAMSSDGTKMVTVIQNGNIWYGSRKKMILFSCQFLLYSLVFSTKK